MAIKMKSKVVEEKVESKVVQKSPEMPLKGTKKTSDSKATKEKKTTPKTAKEAQKPVKEVIPEKFPAVIETKKSKFHKSEEVKVGDFIFLDEGKETNTVLKIVYMGKLNYAVDLTSKGEFAESIIVIEDIAERKIDGFEFEVYVKEG